MMLLAYRQEGWCHSKTIPSTTPRFRLVNFEENAAEVVNQAE